MVVLGRSLGSSAASGWLAASLLLASLLPATTAGAAGFTVASSGDGVDVAPGNGACADAGGACTLRAAIMEANALPGTDAITVTATGTITLGSALPALAHDVSITGPGAGVLTIDAALHGNVLAVTAGVTATLTDLSLTGGNGGPSNTGGGLHNSGTATLTRMRLVANHADYGGAIVNYPGARLTLVDSTLDGNTATTGFGGAIYNLGGGTVVTITGSTISNNTAFNGAVNAPVGTLVTIANSTISGNTATGQGAVAGILGGPNVTCTNCTIVGNHGYGANSPKLRNSIIDSCAPYPTIMLSYGHNVAPSSACFVAPAAGDVFTGNPLLGPLQNNTGPTATHALLAGSPALDAVAPAACTVTVDQRGVPRPQGAACDAGAYELVVIPTPTPTAGCVQPPADLVAWWPLDAPAPSIDDIWAFDNTGTATGALTAVTGWVNGALRFDGSTTFVDVPPSASLDFAAAASSPPGDFSIDTWILQAPTAARSGVRSIVDKRQASGVRGYQFYLFNGQLGVQLADAAFTNYNSGAVVPADGLWHHVALTVERTNSAGVRFYLDGAQVGLAGDATLRPGTLSNGAALRIGAQRFGGQFLDAALDELQIFARSLSAQEVRAIFDAQQFGKCTPTPSVTPTPTTTGTPTITPTVTPTPTPSGHAEICVTKFNDVNGNGVRDPGEPGLAGWSIEITDLFGNVVTVLTTTASGGICGGVPAPAAYTIFEIPQAGWTQTFPAAPGVHNVAVANGQLLNLEFGNWRGATPTATGTGTIAPTPSITPTARPTQTPTATAPCLAPPAGMVGWWALDEQPGASQIIDLAGVPNTGTPRNFNGVAGTITSATTGSAPVPVTSPPLSLASGMVASALYFYGPFIDVPDQAEIDFGSGDLTIDAWVWPPPPTGAGAGVSPIVDKLDLTQQRGYALYLAHAPGGPYNVPTFRIGTGTFTTAAAAVSLTYGMWNHVAVTVNRAAPNGATFYVNGVAAGLGPQSAGNTDNVQPLWIGRSRLSPPAAFAEVALDEIEIFDRVLTPLEVQAIAGIATGGKCKPPRCPGDCDGDARVGIDELVRGVNIALGSFLGGACSAIDLDADGMVSIAELIRAVNHALDGCPTTQLESPDGLGLEIRDVRPAIIDVRPGGTDPATFTVEITAELTNGSGQALYALGALAPERDDLGIDVSNQRPVCKHKFLWWGWDCFNYQVLRVAEEPPLEIPAEPDTNFVVALSDEAPGPRHDGAPADLVVGLIGSRDLTRIAAALDVDPRTLRLGAPPLLPGARLPVHIAVPVHAEIPMRDGTVGIIPLTIGVTLADDTGDSRVAVADCNLYFDWLPGPTGLTLGIGCGYWH